MAGCIIEQINLGSETLYEQTNKMKFSSMQAFYQWEIHDSKTPQISQSTWF